MKRYLKICGVAFLAGVGAARVLDGEEPRRSA